MEEADSSRLLGDRPETKRSYTASSSPLYHDNTDSPTSRLMQLAFVSILGLMVVITVILSIYRAATEKSIGGLYFLLGASLIGFVVVEVFLMLFVKNGDLGKEKVWFVYFVGGCIVVEAMFTDVVLFQ